MNTINKHSVLKQVRQTGVWVGYIAPSKVVSSHVNNGWHLGMDILISIGRDNEMYVVSHNALDFMPLEGYLNNFSYYNCNSGIGQRIRFWEVN